MRTVTKVNSPARMERRAARRVQVNEMRSEPRSSSSGSRMVVISRPRSPLSGRPGFLEGVLDEPHSQRVGPVRGRTWARTKV